MNTIKREFFQGAIASTAAFLVVVAIPWIGGEKTSAFHATGVLIVIGFWITYFLYPKEERKE